MNMGAVDLVREFCEKNADKYYICENYPEMKMSGRRCVGIAVRDGDSYMEMLMGLTRFLDENGFGDPDFEFEGMAVDELGQDTIVYFPAMKRDG